MKLYWSVCSYVSDRFERIGVEGHRFVSSLSYVDKAEQRELMIIVSREKNCTKGRRTKR